ncbi:MAG: hypothetical protein M3401_06135 [Actinomycetota bacterium]|nr:hypothetical protein [Actinomycetota bacterium]
MRFGGPERWAGELGVPVVDHRVGARLSDGEIREALRELLRAHRPARFPSRAWLRDHGPAGLADAVRRSGGTQRWASELGMPAAGHCRWTDERIERELRLMCAGKDRWPSRAEFVAAGRQGLMSVIYRGRGSRWWAACLGLDAQHLRERRSRRQGDEA